LADFQDLYSNRSLNKRDMKAAAAGVTPEQRALKSKDYFQGLQKGLKWNRGADDSITGNYLGTAFHANYRVVTDGSNEQIERNARITSATGKNIIVQLGGHWIPVGYTMAPDIADNNFGQAGNSVIENLENHHQSMGEAFMAGRVINSKTDFPGEEKEIFTRLGTNLYKVLLPHKVGEPAQLANLNTAKATGLRALFTKAGTSVKSLFTPADAWAASNYETVLYVANKWLVWGIAQHSATLTNFFLNGSYRGGTYYCNEGACWGSGSMTNVNGGGCPIVRYAGQWYYPPNNNYGGDYGVPGTWHSCATPYLLEINWPNLPSSYYENGNQHVCNDDTWTQIRAVKGESYHLTQNSGISCGDHTLRAYAPGCGE